MKNVIDNNIDAIAVTVGPGLIGSLLVGVETAKTIAFVTGKPIIPVNHVLAHMYANFVSNQQSAINNQPKLDKLKAESGKLIAFPAISLVVSGGHTELYLMKSMKDLTWLGGTLDDAAGECFDKCARLLGFGNGGGVAVEAAASKCQMQNDQCQIKLPRPMMKDESLNFSFSGLKTAIVREWKKFNITPDVKGVRSSGVFDKNESLVNAFACEIQEAITDVLVEKTLRAAETHNAKSILLSGGVAANTRLREKFLSKLRSSEASKLSLHVPPVSLCTDNAIFIASCAFFCGKPADWHSITAIPDLSVEI